MDKSGIAERIIKLESKKTELEVEIKTLQNQKKTLLADMKKLGVSEGNLEKKIKKLKKENKVIEADITTKLTEIEEGIN